MVDLLHRTHPYNLHGEREGQRGVACTMMSTVEHLQSGNPCESVLISVVTKYTNMPCGSVDMNL